ncbi:hypothetical protein ACFQ07_01270, partial [Actinomadura adrarensis]
GVAQDPDGALRPVAGWYLALAQVAMDDVIDRMEREHEVTPPSEAPETVYWVACRVEKDEDNGRRVNRGGLVDNPADVSVYGTSLAFLLDAAMDSGGDITHLQTGRLADLPD